MRRLLVVVSLFILGVLAGYSLSITVVSASDTDPPIHSIAPLALQATPVLTYSVFLPVVNKQYPPYLSPCITIGQPPMTYGCLITTIAGSGPPNVGDGGPATGAVLEGPSDVLVVADGSLYIIDTLNDRLRKVTPDGIIHTVAGTGSAETQGIGDGLPATMATLRLPRGVTLGPGGSLYIADTNHYRIRRIDPNGIITTVAGTGNFVFYGEGIPATQASFASPFDVAVDTQGNFYIADQVAHRVRKVGLDGIIRTFAGTGTPGSSGNGGLATQAQIDSPLSLALDNQNRLLIGVNFGGPIRRVNLSTNIISGIPGANGSHVTTDAAGNIFFSSGNQIKRVNATNGTITVIAGTGQSGFSGDGGPATQATLNGPTGLSVDASGNVYFADSDNHRVRRIKTNGQIETVAGSGMLPGDGVPAAQAVIYDSQGLAFDRYGNLFFTDFLHNTIRKLANDGMVTTVAGNRRQTFGGDGGSPLQASFSNPTSMEVDPQGNALFIDQTQSVGVVRLITPGTDGIINTSADERIMTVAGQVRSRDEADHGQADGGPAKNAVFVGARGIAVDSHGNLYIADWLDHRVRKVTTGSDGVLDGDSDEIITTIAGNGIAASTGDGGLATQASLHGPNRLAFDSRDNLYIYEDGTGRIRRIDAATGIITTYAQAPGLVSFAFDAFDHPYFAKSTQIVRIHAQTGVQTVIAGTGQQGFSGDGGDALQATFQGAGFLAISQAGEIYVADNGNFRIRRVQFVPR